MCHQRIGKLTRLYTQNIDGLTTVRGTPLEKIVAVHGSIGRVACEGVRAVRLFRLCAQVRCNIKDIYKQDADAPSESSPIACEHCKRPLVKPTTVLFGSSLPEEFFTRSEEDMPSTDLLLVAGTSLVVSPANSLVYRVNSDAVRVVINNEPVGAELGLNYGGGGGEASRDLFLQGDCDDVFLNLMRELGWLSGLEAIADALPEESRARLDAALRAP